MTGRANQTGDVRPYEVALAAAGLPEWLRWSVEIRPRRTSIGATVEPGGAVVFLLPPAATAEQVTAAVARTRRRVLAAATQKAEHGAHIATKDLVNGEGFTLVGTNHRLRLVDDSDSGRLCPCMCKRPITAHPGVPIIGEPGHTTWSGYRTWQLTMRRDAASANTVVGWYRAEGMKWLNKHVPEMAARLRVAPGLTWQVRRFDPAEPIGATWATYRPATHSIAVHWMVFQFPRRLLEYIAAHEVAHASRPGGKAHGPDWESAVGRLVPDWREVHGPARTANGLVLWAGAVTAASGSGAVAPGDGATGGPDPWSRLLKSLGNSAETSGGAR